MVQRAAIGAWREKKGLSIVDAFRDHGYDLEPRGYSVGGKLLTGAEMTLMTVRDRALATHDEAVHARSHLRQRTEAMSGTINCLRDAVRRKKLTEMTRVLSHVEEDAEAIGSNRKSRGLAPG